VTAESILQLLDPSSTSYSGQILFGGENLLRLGEGALRKVRGNRISMIFQDPMSALNPVFTIGDQLTEAILAHERIRETTRTRFRDRVCLKDGNSRA
jgi:ABC-type microcin C transport system duplicated ATPase subunit YejF